jgi:hypothetical protein
MSDEELLTEEPLPDLPEPFPEETPEPPMPPKEWDQKEEEFEPWEEKEEKGQGLRRDPISGITWALILIAVGTIFLAENTLRLFDFEQFGGAWNLILIAVGLILLLEVALRLLLPEYRRPITGTLVFGLILLGLGLTSAIGFQVTWPIFVIAIGVAMLISGLLRWR